ncbi:hypothetical protein [Nostoc sp. PCC 9305]|uniref:hypothetical protein n=1 Tax=Nostoc sp. PCC 9305 TaxID=296636 RepID=UPI0039C682F5
MCRLLANLGSPISLEHLLYKPEHSLIVQSYQPREMISGVVNADGFGVGWYHNQKDTNPFIYKNTLPIWNDINLLIASRFATTSPPPSLYWIRDDPTFPQSVIIASEPLFLGNWIACPENSIISVGADCEIQIEQI